MDSQQYKTVDLCEDQFLTTELLMRSPLPNSLKNLTIRKLYDPKFILVVAKGEPCKTIPKAKQAMNWETQEDTRMG